MTALDDEPVIALPGRTDDVTLAEKTVLASMIASRRAAEDLLDILGGEDTFGGALHRAVYAAARWLAEQPAAKPGTLATGDADGDTQVQGRFAAILGRLAATEQGVWRTGSAAAILAEFMRYVSPGYRTAAEVVLRAATQRRTVAALEAAMQAASRPGFDGAEHGDMIRGLLEEALGGARQASTAVTAAELFTQAAERLDTGRPPGVIQFPWAALRDIVPFLRPGQLVTILARPSIGKSTAATDLARYTGLRRQIPCILFTLEMDRDEMIDRLIAAEAGVLHERVTGGILDDGDWDRINRASDRFAEGELVIDDAPRITLPHIRAGLRGMARTGKPAELAIVDYVQLMEAPGSTENRQQEIAALTGGLKATAREFRIPVVMLGQLNRGPEHRQDRMPRMSDARESGSVENDSDIVILVHREDFYDPESPRAGEADLIVDKHRGGRRGTAVVGFHGQYTRFVDLAWTPSTALKGTP